MLKCKFTVATYFLFLLLICSCNSKQKEVSITTVRFNNLGELGVHYSVRFPNDGVERDMPKLYRDNVLYRERRKTDSALNIGSLENGFDVQQIRINGNEHKEYKNGWNRFLVLTHKNSWSADVYYLRFAVQDGFTRTIDSLQYQKYSLSKPKLGWDKFIDSLKQLGLFTLPDYSLVHGYGADLDTDEFSYEVEIASNKKYRIYSYPDPAGRTQKFAEAKKFMQIIDFIKSEFSFPEPWTPNDETKDQRGK